VDRLQSRPDDLGHEGAAMMHIAISATQNTGMLILKTLKKKKTSRR
jgi:hypothetical protein